MSNNKNTILEALRLLIESYRDLNDIELNNAVNVKNDILISFYIGHDFAYKELISAITRLENIKND